MAKPMDARLKDLRQQAKEIKKAIKEIKNVDKVDAALAKWAEMDKLKQDFSLMLSTKHNTTLKKVMALPDFFTHAEVKGTRKASRSDISWVVEAIKNGANEAGMIKRADELKAKYIRKVLSPTKRKTKTTTGDKTSTGNEGKAAVAKDMGAH
jgi:hypothetical protein